MALNLEHPEKYYNPYGAFQGATQAFTQRLYDMMKEKKMKELERRKEISDISERLISGGGYQPVGGGPVSPTTMVDRPETMQFERVPGKQPKPMVDIPIYLLDTYTQNMKTLKTFKAEEGTEPPVKVWSSEPDKTGKGGKDQYDQILAALNMKADNLAIQQQRARAAGDKNAHEKARAENEAINNSILSVINKKTTGEPIMTTDLPPQFELTQLYEPEKKFIGITVKKEKQPVAEPAKPKKPQYTKGQIIDTPKGRVKITGFDTDGTPLIMPLTRK